MVLKCRRRRTGQNDCGTRSSTPEISAGTMGCCHAGLKRKLIGFEVTDRGIARDEQDILVNGERVGRVTSGSPAPYLKKNIGMGYVPTELANEGQELHID